MRLAKVLLPLLASVSIFADASSAIRPTLVAPRSATYRLLIPAAGSVQGGNGTFFKTDLTLTNFRDVDQKVALQWMPRAVSGNTFPPAFMTIPRLTSIVSEDFVGQELRQAGLGSILITAIRSDDTDDTAGLLHSTARIWTFQPGSAGTVSQTFPTIAFPDITTNRLTILGQRQDGRYRANVGVVNLDPEAIQNFEILVSNRTDLLAEMNIELPPMSMQQVALPASINSDFLRIKVIPRPANPARMPFYTAYGASVDNVTGDSWSTLGFVAPGD